MDNKKRYVKQQTTIDENRDVGEVDFKSEDLSVRSNDEKDTNQEVGDMQSRIDVILNDRVKKENANKPKDKNAEIYDEIFPDQPDIERKYSINDDIQQILVK